MKYWTPRGQLMWILRVALSGQQYTPGGAVDIAMVLGKDETINRLKQAVVNLVGYK